MAKQYLSPTELAEYLGISIHTVYFWVSSKQIPFVKLSRLVRFDISEIEEWLKDKRIEPTKKI